MHLFKKGDKTSIENYRSISLLSSISKVLQRVVFNQWCQYLGVNNVLFYVPYGFRKHKYTTTWIMDKSCIHIIYISKAFDTLDYSILLSKLRHYENKNKAFQWFNSHLSYGLNMWNLRVLPPGAFGLKMGVARGSVLGPLLFMRYVDDMHTVSSKFTFCTYADDTTLTGPMVSFVFGSIYIIHPISKGIDNKIKNIANWLAAKKLSLYLTKT